MSASDAQRARPAVPSSSRRIWRHASARWARWRDRIAGAQQRRDGLAHGVVDDEAFPPELDERQRAQPREGLLRRLVGQQRGEQRERHAAQHRGGVQRAARRGLQPVEVQRGELLQHGGRHGAGGRAGPLADRRRAELQRQRMAAREAVDPRGLGVVEARPVQDLPGGVGLQRPGGDREHQRAERAAPRGAGCVAGGQHDTRVLRQRGEEVPAQPVVDEAQALGGVEHDDHRGLVGEGGHSPGGRRAGGAPQRGEDALRRRLDVAAVEREHRRAAPGGLGGQRAHERRLARPGDAVHDGQQRAVVVEQGQQPRQLGLAADHRRPTLGQERSERARHRDLRRPAPARDRARRRAWRSPA